MRSLPFYRIGLLAAAAAWLALLVPIVPAHAQDASEELEDIFGDLGTAEAVEGDDDAPSGGIFGRVYDGETGAPLSGASVILNFPDPGDGSDPRQEVAVTELDGSYQFPSVPPGEYDLTFIKAGYRASTMTAFEVREGEESTADFPLPPVPTEAGGDVLELDAFVVEASVVDEMMAGLELRMESDQLLNIMSAEDLSKFAASDVADALKRVSGVNVAEGQFAIIRGLEDRYSSTLYNGAPVPSPDPDRQSVQLDLFPSDVVENLVVSKNFKEDMPSNSAAGSIDILTNEYPDDVEISLGGGAGWEGRAASRFLAYDEFNPVSEETDDVTEYEYGGSIGGRTDFLGREVRFKGVFNDEVDFGSQRGFQEERQPDRARSRRGRVQESGDLSLGIASLSGGLYDFTQSERSDQITGFLAGGIDLDPEGAHTLDTSFFYTMKKEEVVELRENGFFPNVDYAPLLSRAMQFGFQSIQADPDFIETAVQSSALAGFRSDGGPERGHPFYTIFERSRNFQRERDLMVVQLNGDHAFGFLNGLSADWAANYAITNQEQTSFGLNYFFEPDDPDASVPASVPASVDDLGPGQWAVRNSVTFDTNEIEETQWFGRLDLEYERPVTEFLDFTLSTGGWYEQASRDVDARFLLNAAAQGSGVNFAVFDDSPRAVAGQIFGLTGLGDPNGGSAIAESTNESERLVQAVHAGGKASFWESLDLLGGVRVEDVYIESRNDPFTGDINPIDGSPVTFPSRYLFFDRYDNPNLVFESAAPAPGNRPPGFTFNDEILGIDVPIDPMTGFVDLPTRQDLLPLINGEIDELKVLPTFAVVVRPPWVNGLTLRGAYSQTVARPSFREMGFYVTTEPGTDDKTVGNPQLGLSEVESWDARIEYLFGDLGDLVATSFFVKTIEDPIEAIIVRDPSDFTQSTFPTFRTFFNNETDADLLGLEFEGRLHLGLYGLFGRFSDFLDDFSIGGNYTWIEASVGRSRAEVARTVGYFGVVDGDAERFAAYEDERPLFNQPEWIANADISFDNPDWGTRITLAYFAISDRLDAAGTVGLQPDGQAFELTLDRYDASFYQLDLVASQEFALPNEWGTITFKSSIKNLTDSARKVIYDKQQLVDEISERRYKVGPDYSFSVRFKYRF